MFSIISDDIESKEASDFTFIEHFDFVSEFSDHCIVSFDRRSGNEDMVDILDRQDNVSTNVYAGI